MTTRTASKIWNVNRLMRVDTIRWMINHSTHLSPLSSPLSTELSLLTGVRVGNEEANAKTKHATTRGTSFHLVFEHYLQNKDYKSP